MPPPESITGEGEGGGARGRPIGDGAEVEVGGGASGARHRNIEGKRKGATVQSVLCVAKAEPKDRSCQSAVSLLASVHWKLWPMPV